MILYSSLPYQLTSQSLPHQIALRINSSRFQMFSVKAMVVQGGITIAVIELVPGINF
jgi:hypothetical protein